MLLAVYGTLRNGGHLHERFMTGASPISEEIELQGYEMFSLGGYPYVTAGKGKITVEVYDLESEVFDKIRNMECGSGYTDETIMTGFGLVHIFVFSADKHKQETEYNLHRV